MWEGSAGDTLVSVDDPRPPTLSRETSIRRDGQGRWFHEGEPVDNRSVARAFDRWIARAPDGRYCLKNEVNWAYVEIEGAPVLVRAIQVVEDEVRLDLSDDRTERLATETLRQSHDGRLYCDVRGGSLTAEFSSSAAVQLAPWLEEDLDFDLALDLDLDRSRVSRVALVLGRRRIPILVVDDPIR
ncbi:MAG: DUF1285 domain-containing protein [Deltaproteobacteria bacterium]|nr:DUF1285 domain-containing protein [Deltaproteobacteria bacterium]